MLFDLFPWIILINVLANSYVQFLEDFYFKRIAVDSFLALGVLLSVKENSMNK